MTCSLMIVQQGVLPTLLEFPTHKAAEIAARELRVESDSLQIINNSSGKVTNFSAVLKAEARVEEELSAARYRAHIDSLPEGEIRRIYAQHKEELDRREERRRAYPGGIYYGSNVLPLHPSVKHRMDKIEEHDKLERQWIEAMEELCGLPASEELCGLPASPVNTCSKAAAPECHIHQDALYDSARCFAWWAVSMLVVVAAAYAVG